MTQTVVITGASAGIGAACAEVYAEKGARLVLGARRMDKLETLKQRLPNQENILCARLDVGDSDSVAEFTTAAREFCSGKVDVVVNNAGLAVGVDHVVDGKAEDWQTMLDTNVMGLLKVTRAFLPDMKERGHGHIVNMGSIAGFQTYAGGAVYAATKHAVKAITGALRMELLGSGIRISSIDPGLVETEFSNVRLGDKDKAKQVYAGLTPLNGRDIAECVEFATSRPPHVNIDHVIVMPTDQASAYQAYRRNS